MQILTKNQAEHISAGIGPGALTGAILGVTEFTFIHYYLWGFEWSESLTSQSTLVKASMIATVAGAVFGAALDWAVNLKN